VKHRPIDQQVVAIMGSASGIGRETAFQFASRGAKLVIADNDAKGLKSLTSELKAKRAQVVSVVADVANFEQVRGIAKRAVQQYGRLDTWVGVAAVSLYATFMDTTPDEFKRIVDVNLLGQVYGAQVALPHLIESGSGALIVISSVEARRALPYQSAYSAAKHGIDGFLEALRLELRDAGLPVSVTQIMPASINTPLFSKARTKLGVKPQGVPPLYSPSLVAKAVVHAAEHPHRDIIVGGAGKMLVNTQRLSPRLADAILQRAGFALQRTSEPRSANASNNLFGPAGQDNRVQGDSGTLTLAHSLSTWLDLHPAIKATATVGAAVGLVALTGRQSGNDRDKPSN